MALWAVMAAPLIMSNDLQNVRPEIKAILQHKDIIAINKDPLGAHGKRVYKKDKIQIWVKPILPKIGGEESYAIVVLNRKVHWQPELFSIELKELGLNAKKYKQRVNISKSLYVGRILNFFGLIGCVRARKITVETIKYLECLCKSNWSSCNYCRANKIRLNITFSDKIMFF